MRKSGTFKLSIAVAVAVLFMGCVSKSKPTENFEFSRRPSSAGQFKPLPAGIAYVDLRDVTDFHTPYAGMGQIIISALMNDPSRFVGSSSNARYSDTGPKGPLGRIEGHVFLPSDTQEATRKNAILTAMIENVVEEQREKIYRVNLILFVHDTRNNQSPYFFRRLSLRVNWTLPRSAGDQRVQDVTTVEDIGLSQTRFALKADLFERKLILEDTSNQLWLVFPIQAATLDIRTAPTMDGAVTTMTGEWPNAVVKSPRLTGEFHDESFLNTRGRTWPPYFQGRPYFAIYADGKSVKSPHTDYIGIYGMFRDRDFSTLGGIRMRDQDIYILDALLNEGQQQEMSAQIMNSLPEYASLDPAFPPENGRYQSLVYSDAPVDKTQICRSPYQQIAYYFNGNMHTVFSKQDCATRFKRIMGPVLPILNYAKGLGGTPPQPASL